MAQENRYLEFNSPLDNSKILFRGFQGREQISRLFKFNVEFVKIDGEFSENELISKLVGSNVTLRIDKADGSPRHFNGHVSRVVAGYDQDFGTVYRAEVVPWLWFLTQTSDCRIFQNKKTNEIIQQIFDDLGFSDYTLDIKGELKKWDYCVQYRETDFNFVSRMMEEEGIMYFFKHEQGKHTLVLTNHTGAYYTLPESKVKYGLSRGASGHHEDMLLSWERQIDFVTGKWAQTDYNFETPSTSLMANESCTLKLPDAKKFELYDYPGEYLDTSVGKRQTKLRMEEIEAPFNQVFATSACKTFSCGGKFTVDKDHPSSAEIGKSYVITEINHASVESSSGQDKGAEYSNSFTCIPDAVIFRPQRRTPKPLISGLQSAVVVGPKGEEIYTDKYGRVKVQFFWDREGKRDENSSCWIRCVQRVAGKKWGHMAIPRIGQEVLVEFLEGDPDRPVIVGGVYNAEQMPHYDPTEHPDRTYIKTNSTKGGDGFNELFFDDKMDKERIFLHAEKDIDVRVKNDSRERIVHNRSQIIGHDQYTDDNGASHERGGYQRELVYGDKHQNLKGHHHYHIEGSQWVKVGAGDGQASNPGEQHTYIENQQFIYVGDKGRHHVIDGSDMSKVGGEIGVTVQGNHSTKCGADYSLDVQNNLILKSLNASLDAGMNIDAKAGMKCAVEGGMEVHVKGGMSVVVEAGLSLTLKVGGNFINISPAGIAIQGTTVLINSGGAPGSGGGCAPDAPKEPKQPTKALLAEPQEPEMAHDEKTGYKSSPD